MLGCVILKYRKGRISGAGPASVLSCAIMLIMLVTGVCAEPVAVKSDDAYAPSAPILSEPSTMRVPLGAGAATTRTAETTAVKNISLDFHAADIADVLKALSTQTGTNIVTGNDVKGQVTVALTRVGLKDALDMVTKLSGYKYAMVGPNTYAVGSAQGLNAVLGTDNAGSNVAVEVVSLQYANGDELAKTIPDLIPGVKVSFANMVAQGDDRKDSIWDVTKPGQDPTVRAKPSSKPSRVLVLVGEPQAVALAKDVALKSEEAAKTCGGQIVMEVYFPMYTDATELGQVASSVSSAVSVTLGPTTNFQLKQDEMIRSGTMTSTYSGAQKYEFKAQPATIVLTGPVEDVKRVMAALKQVDIKPAQILIEARIADISDDDEKKLGIEWSWTNLEFNEGTKSNGGGNGHFVRLPVDFSATLDAMITNGKGKLLANPKVAALVGKPANIFIGDQVTYVSGILPSATGQPTIQTTTVDVGIQLRAIGIVGAEDDITLNLHPEVSTITGFSEAGGLSIPQIASRYTDSTIRIKSGATVAIGGLIKDQDIVNMSKVPLLGDLPFFGQLFRHTDHTKHRSEVTIFLTATVLKDQ